MRNAGRVFNTGQPGYPFKRLAGDANTLAFLFFFSPAPLTILKYSANRSWEKLALNQPSVKNPSTDLALSCDSPCTGSGAGRRGCFITCFTASPAAGTPLSLASGVHTCLDQRSFTPSHLQMGAGGGVAVISFALSMDVSGKAQMPSLISRSVFPLQKNCSPGDGPALLFSCK